MRMMRAPGLPPMCLLAALMAGAPAAPAQTSTSEAVVLGTGGYRLNFGVTWTCDDSPGATQGAPGEVDLVDAKGNLVGQVTATVSGSTPVVTVTGAGSVSSLNDSVLIRGAGGTPADGHLHGVWTITGPAPGAYTLRFWLFTNSVPGRSLSTISTLSMDTGGGGSLSAPTPTPSPTPTPVPSPPSVSLAAPSSATVFQAVPLSAAATAGGTALASVVISVSADNGGTWSTVLSNPHPSNPSDTDNVSYAFGSVGNALLRSTATDAAGRTASSAQAVAVGKASQPAVSILPPSLTLTAGQGATFTASGGATGNYSWGGSASGSGPSKAVTFPAPGTYPVTVADSGNATYSPSGAASATVTVTAPFFMLSAAASGGGTVAGGGSYPPNAQAVAVATPGSGNSFTGWTGDVTLGAPTVSVLMNADKSIMAHFAALLAQAISFVPPGTVTTRSPPFALSVSASSGLPVSLALTSGPVALAGNVVTPLGPTGAVVLAATQPGNAQYLAAPTVVISFSVGNPPPGVILSDDSSTTRRSDKATRATTYISVPAH